MRLSIYQNVQICVVIILILDYAVNRTITIKNDQYL